MTDAVDLKRQLEAAYAAIRELDDDLAAGRISADDHADLKRRSERQAVALVTALREAERASHAAGRSAPARPATDARHARRARNPLPLAIGGAALLLFGMTLGVLGTRFLADESVTATATAATAPQTGARPAAGAPAVSPALEALRKQVEVDDAPIAKLNAFAHQALDEGQTAAAIWAYKRVLAREPKNVEAITHIGLILYQGNHVDQALARIDEALALDPKYAHAHWDRANILVTAKQDDRAAIASLEKFLALVATGDDADRARTMLTDARKRLAAGTKPPAPAPAAATPAGSAQR